MKKLYEISFTCYALGDDEDDACDNAQNEMDRFNCDVEAVEIGASGGILATWMDYPPFGNEDDATCRQLLEQIKANDAKTKERLEWEKRQLKLFDV